MTDGDKGIQGKAAIRKTLETKDCQEVTGRAATDREQKGQHVRGKTEGLRMRRKLPKLGGRKGNYYGAGACVCGTGQWLHKEY